VVLISCFVLMFDSECSGRSGSAALSDTYTSTKAILLRDFCCPPIVALFLLAIINGISSTDLLYLRDAVR
jgi:hypothetical protein